MSAALRIIDANANRAREALRVMEDAARFIRNDAALSAELKTIRHDLAQALAALPDLALHRDTLGDVGTTLSTPSENRRADTTDVIIAAGKRLSEALRTIEEYGKTLGDRIGAPGFAQRIEQLRYRGYEVERRLSLVMSRGAKQQWRLCLLITEALCHGDWWQTLEQAVEAGVDCIQVREKEMEDGPLLQRVQRVVDHFADRATVIVNDSPHIAAAAGAHGVHLGQHDLPCETVRQLFGQDLLIGVSTSTLAEAEDAYAQGADYVGVGPMFPTTTKHKPVLAGPTYLKQFLEWSTDRDLPHLAIGGITPQNLPELVANGAQGVAVSSTICAADDPAARTNQLLQCWG